MKETQTDTTAFSESSDSKIKACVADMIDTANKMPGAVIIHDLRDWSVAWMNERGLIPLGVSLEYITSITAEEYYSQFFNPEDAKDYVPKVLGLLERNNDEEICVVFQQVRFASERNWKWHFASTKILLRDEAEKPLLAVTIAIPIDGMHYVTAKVERLLEENNFLRRHYHHFAKLTSREHDILRLMALGKSSLETSEILFISTATVDTHRKNIKQKLNTNSFFELSQYARAFDLI
ncbi:response regulator transcription factor [Pontibacter toksunensis]|uniref:Response regulator transcription factor n=1 Tax=Pontibacter toksunensis TaxID=1332631 RepID=A0ABW6BXT4_9BACT